MNATASVPPPGLGQTTNWYGKRSAVAIGMDIGQAHDKCVLIAFRQEDEKSPAYVMWVRVLAGVTFPEMRAMAHRAVRQFNADILVVDNTGIGRDTGEYLQFTLPCTVVRYDFSDQSKSDMMGIAWTYFTSGLVRCHHKYRQFLVELSHIKRLRTPAGNFVFRDDPHGDWSWAGALGLYGLKRMVGDVGIRDASGIFEPYARRKMFDRAPPGVDPPRDIPVPRGRVLGQTLDGQPLAIKLPTNSCGLPTPHGPCPRAFSNPEWLDLHIRNDHPEEWARRKSEAEKEPEPW